MRRCLAALFCAVLFGCPKDDGKPPLPPRDGPLGARTCSAEPGRKNPRRPIFSKPFAGEFPVYNMFDHLTPGQFRPFDSNNNELAYCGIDMLGLTEGYEGYSWGLPLGTPILSVADGEVVHAGVDDEFYCVLPELRRSVDNQLSVHVKHEGLAGMGFITIYQHLEKIDVKKGDRVGTGQTLGRSGRSGCANEPVFYFGVLRLMGTKTGKPTSVDPYGWDGPRPDPWQQHEKGVQSYYLWIDGEAPKLAGRVKN